MDTICDFCVNLDVCQYGCSCLCGQPIDCLGAVIDDCCYFESLDDYMEIERRTNIYNMVNSLHHKS